MKKKLLSLLLALVMVLSVFPVTVFAGEDTEMGEPAEEIVEEMTETPTEGTSEEEESAEEELKEEISEGVSEATEGADEATETTNEAIELDFVAVEVPTLFAGRDDGTVLRTDICKIGNQGYESFQDAVNAVPADGQEVVITLLKSVYAEGTTIIPKGKNITIELNGKTYAFENGVPGVALFTNYGTLTFQDQTDTKRNGTGRGQVMSYPLMPDMSPCPGYAQNTVTNKGTVNVKSGYIMSQGDGQAAFVIDCQAIHASNDVALNVSGGKLESVSSSVAVRMYTHKNYACDVSITGGVVTSLWVQDGNGGAEGKGSLTIKKPGMVEYNVGVTGYAGGVLKHFKLDIDDTEIGTGLTYNFDPNEPDNTISVNNLKAASFTMKTPKKVLSNGYFMNPVDAACIVDGYVCLLNPDKNVKNAKGKVYTYKICKEDEVDLDNIEYAARVIHADETYTDYYTMGYAMSAVQNGETVQLLADAYGRALVNENQKITFDLNGYTLNGYFKNNGGDLTVEDTSEAKTGKVIGEDVCLYVSGYTTDYVATKTTVNGGTFELTDHSADSGLIWFYGYDMYATTTINGGVFKSTGAEELIAYDAPTPYGFGSIVINGGEIDAVLDYSDQHTFYTYANNAKMLEITGGHFTKRVSGYVGWYGKSYGTISISGGTFDDEVDLLEYYYDEATITGGNFGNDAYVRILQDFKNPYYYIDYGVYGGNFKYAKYSDGSDLLWVREAADGLAKASNTDEETMAEYPWTLKPLQIDKKRVEVDENGQITSMDVKNQDGTATAPEDAQAIADALAQSNTTVDNFADTNLDKAFTGKKKTDGYDLSVALDAIAKQIASDPYLAENYEVVIDEHNAIKIQEKKEGSSDIQKYKDEDVDVKVKVDPQSASVQVNSELVGEDTVKTAIVNTETFEVKPIAKTSITVKTVEQVENPETHEMEDKEVETQYKVEAPLKNEDIKEPITFPLPIDKNSPAGVTAVYHSDDEDDLFKDYLGLYEIMTDPETGDKFILIEADSFSFYTIQNMNSITTTNVVAIKDANGNYRGFDTLAEGIADYGEDVGKVFLESDFSGTAYADAAAAQATVTVYKNTEGDGKFYLTEDFSGTGYDTAAEAKEAVPVFQKPADKSLIILKPLSNVNDDFLEKSITLDLNGLDFIGAVTNAKNVTVENNDDLHQKTLAAIGVYGVNVSEFVADGYAARTSTPVVTGVVKNEVFKTTEAGVYSVKVVTSTNTDRDGTNNMVDLYAGDKVKVEVRVYGAKFVAADVTLAYDCNNFKLVADDPNWQEFNSDYAGMEDEGETPTGLVRYYSGGSGYLELDKTDETGEEYYLLGEFEFEAKALDESTFGSDPALKVPFEVKAEGTGSHYPMNQDGTSRKTYVAGAKSQGWTPSAADEIGNENLQNGYANIRLIEMTASVVPAKNSEDPSKNLVYKDAEQNLLKSWSAMDSFGHTVTGTAIKCAVYPKEDVEQGFIPTVDEYFDDISSSSMVDAGDYVVFYQVSKPGYVTFTGQQEVTIDKKAVDITWTPDPVFDGGTTVAYSETGGAVLQKPVAKFADVGSNEKTAFVKLDTFDGITVAAERDLKAVGEYGYKAFVEDTTNYFINSGETYTLTIEGGTFEGYTLTNGNDGNAVYYDMQSHIPAKLNIANAPKPAVADATVTYFYKKATDLNWTESSTIPQFSAMGTYLVKAKLTADSYKDYETDPVVFTVKNVDYTPEAFDWVTGWDIVLVYTNEDVSGFTYDGTLMYNMDGLGYKYGSVKNGDGTKGDKEYKHVFGLVVFGLGDTTKVVSSNDTAKSIELTNTKNRWDVNNTKSVDINDYVAVQSVYNVDDLYLNAQQMAIVLKSDVNGDKMVNTLDCSKIKFNTDNR